MFTFVTLHSNAREPRYFSIAADIWMCVFVREIDSRFFRPLSVFAETGVQREPRAR